MLQLQQALWQLLACLVGHGRRLAWGGGDSMAVVSACKQWHDIHKKGWCVCVLWSPC